MTNDNYKTIDRLGPAPEDLLDSSFNETDSFNNGAGDSRLFLRKKQVMANGGLVSSRKQGAQINSF